MIRTGPCVYSQGGGDELWNRYRRLQVIDSFRNAGQKYRALACLKSLKEQFSVLVYAASPHRSSNLEIAYGGFLSL